MGKIITPDNNLTLDGMIDDEEAQTLQLQASINAVNRRLLQTYQTEEELKHSLNNLYLMVEKLQRKIQALMQFTNLSEDQLDEIMNNDSSSENQSIQLDEIVNNSPFEN